MGKLGGKADTTAQAITKMFSDPEQRICAAAARALGTCVVEVKTTVPKLTALLDDPKGTVRTSAAIALGDIGPAARFAVPAGS